MTNTDIRIFIIRRYRALRSRLPARTLRSTLPPGSGPAARSFRTPVSYSRRKIVSPRMYCIRGGWKPLEGLFKFLANCVTTNRAPRVNHRAISKTVHRWQPSAHTRPFTKEPSQVFRRRGRPVRTDRRFSGTRVFLILIFTLGAPVRVRYPRGARCYIIINFST